MGLYENSTKIILSGIIRKYRAWLESQGSAGAKPLPSWSEAMWSARDSVWLSCLLKAGSVLYIITLTEDTGPLQAVGDEEGF